jgi:hypothetical protein
MKSRRFQPRFLLLAAATVCLVPACVWDPWIPGQSKWNPEIVVDPANALQQLALDAPYVDELDCYARRCQKRFRLVVEQSGQLTVQAMLELASQDEQARMVLEATRGVVAQDSTGRGPRTDVPVLALRRAVERGTYFVLLQSIGGRIPYELTATLTPGAGPTPSPRAEAPPPEMPRQPKGPAFRFEKIELGAGAGADYDPAVDFSGIRTFTFPPPQRPAEALPAGTRLETPEDRQIRRLLAEALALKGMRQATGDEEADLMVTFSTGEKSLSFHAFPLLYERYGVTRMGSGFGVDTRGTLVVDMVEVSSGRMAWHAWTTRGLGPGITYGAETTALLREAIADILAKFPPR